VIAFACALFPRERCRAALEAVESAFPNEPSLLMRCIRDAQAYEVDGFSRAIDNVMRDLSSQPPNAWQRAQFDEFSMACSALEEDVRHAAVVHRRVMLSLGAFVTKICQAGVVDKVQLVEEVLRRDPRFAVRIGAQLGVNISALPSAAMIDAAAEWEFLSFALESARAIDNSDRERWLCVLGEAALRYGFVARTLYGEPLTSDLAKNLQTIPKDTRWQESAALKRKRSLLGGVLAFGASSEKAAVAAQESNADGVIRHESDFARLRLLSLTGRQIIVTPFGEAIKESLRGSASGIVPVLASLAGVSLSFAVVSSVGKSSLGFGFIFFLGAAFAVPLVSQTAARLLRKAGAGIPELARLPTTLISQERYLLNLRDSSRVPLIVDFVVLRVPPRDLVMVRLVLVDQYKPRDLVNAIASRRITGGGVVTGGASGRRVRCEVSQVDKDGNTVGSNELEGLDLSGMAVSRQVCAVIDSCEQYRLFDMG
jgi:hypothetical protein